MPNEKDNVDRRYGKYYTRRKRRRENINMTGPRSSRRKRTTYTPLTYTLHENRPIVTTVPQTLVDVPIAENEITNIPTSNGPTSVRPIIDGMIEVPVQVLPFNTTTTTMPTFMPPNSSTISILRPPLDTYSTTPSFSHYTFGAPLGTFDAPASSSGSSNRRRTPRAPRTNFHSIIIQRWLTRRERNTINQRLRRARLTVEQRAASQARDTIRRRGLRASQSSHHRNLTQAINTAYKRFASRRSAGDQTRSIGQILSVLNTQGRGQNNAPPGTRGNSGENTSRNIRQEPSNAKLFRQSCHALKWIGCSECNARFPDMTITRGLCAVCSRDKKKNPVVPIFSAANCMDPGDIPIELSRLSNLESILIARIHPMISVYRVKGQQYRYSGNVINFAQDVQVVADVLPCKPTDLSAVLIVKRTGPNSMKEFVVRREYVRQALLWLQQNHRYYNDIIIDSVAINELPQDGVPVDLPNVEEVDQETSIDQNPSEILNEGGNPVSVDDDIHIDEFEAAGTIAATIQPNQQRCIRRALHMPAANHTVAELPFQREPINEYTREGYISMAFPTLFPYGVADLRQARPRNVKPTEYFQYLMKYKDARFAKDVRFRYFAWNSLTRWRASSLGQVYVNNNPEDGDLTIQDIRNMLESGDTRLATRVSYYGQQLRGTRAYWFNRLKELTAMVNQLGPPTIFFTLSAADMQWPELFDLIDPSNNLQNLSPIQQRKEKARLLNENPLIAAWFLQKRVELFYTSFLKTEFSVVDYWYRYEWQNRGSGHVHGFLWIKDSPDVSQIATNEQIRQRVCEYFDQLVTTINPDPNFSLQMQNHPCARVISADANLDDDDNDYIALVNWVERHSKCGNYCLRMNKRTKQLVCRFKYPTPILEESKIIEEPPNSNMYRYMGRRNDEYVNSHNRRVMQNWRANIDISAVISKETMVRYVAKYATKSEPTSKNFTESLGGIVGDLLRPCQSSTSAIKRLLLKTVSERDISAQEVCHLIMGYPLTKSSRKYVLLNLYEKSMFRKSVRRRTNNQSTEIVATTSGFVQRYMQRQVNFENCSLLQMAKKHYWSKGTWRTYKRDAIVRIIPELDNNISPDNEKWEEFCRQQVLLRHPYRSLDEAKGGFETWSDQYTQLGFHLQHTIDPPVDIDDELEDDSEIEDADCQHDEWMVAAGMGPGYLPDIAIGLGMREIDTSHDWSRGLTHYPNIEDDRRFVSVTLKSQEHQNNDSSYGPLVIDMNQLSPEQKAAHDMVLSSLNLGSTIRLIISGGAGTGKSTLISAIVRSTSELFGTRKAVRVMASTGVAAFNIHGSTVHHELSISVDQQSNHQYKNLEGDHGGRMQEEFKDTKLLIIDEYIMIGRKMLANIDFRCRDIFGGDHSFGNVSIILVGDMRQLPPVCDSPLYAEGRYYMQQQGGIAYSSFDRCVQLRQVFRQSGNEQSTYREALQRLSDGKSTLEDWMLFKTRDFTVLSPIERYEFKYALRLFPIRKAADQYNIDRLEELKKPIAMINSLNNNQTAKKAGFDEAKGLQQQLLLSIGARVMLKTNLATNYGLVNGARGIIEDIVYAPGCKTPNDMPLAVMVDFDEYPGPKFKQSTNIVPITPQSASWKSSSGVSCQRTQLPLVLCWAITVHKSQGLTLDKAVVDIGERESLGLTFVALSRTRKLTDLAFSPMFSFERLQNIGKCSGLKRRREEERRLHQLSINAQ